MEPLRPARYVLGAGGTVTNKGDMLTALGRAQFTEEEQSKQSAQISFPRAPAFSKNFGVSFCALC